LVSHILERRPIIALLQNWTSKDRQQFFRRSRLTGCSPLRLRLWITVITTDGNLPGLGTLRTMKN
jgi:hypothetical protein